MNNNEIVSVMKQALEFIKDLPPSSRGIRVAMKLDEAIATAVAEPHKESSNAAKAAATQEPAYWLGYGLQAHTEKPFEGATPLYTHSQPKAEQCIEITNIPSWTKKITVDIEKHEWVGLTDDRVEELIDSLFHFDGTRWSTDTPRAVIQEIIKECE